jgi:hypothetical protein
MSPSLGLPPTWPFTSQRTLPEIPDSVAVNGRLFPTGTTCVAGETAIDAADASDGHSETKAIVHQRCSLRDMGGPSSRVLVTDSDLRATSPLNGC